MFEDLIIGIIDKGGGSLIINARSLLSRRNRVQAGVSAIVRTIYALCLNEI